MLYFGQELGERGMEAEGFSGLDGRTTIFDYWTIDSIRRWRNKGRFDSKLLTPEELSLQNTYRSILKLREQTLCMKGGFYDLMYANPHLSRQYAFVRHRGKEMALIIANFSDREEVILLNLPGHFFEFTGIKAKSKMTLTNILDNKKISVPFNFSEPLTITLPANYGVVLY